MTQGARHIIVVGAGIVGVSAAIWLRRDGHEVTLVDRAGPGEGTSFGNGGVLAACAVVPVTVPGLLRKAPHMLFHPEQPLFLKWRHVPRLLPWLRRYMGHANDPDVRRIARALTPILGASLSDHQELAAGTPARHRITPCDYLYAYRDRRHFEADAFGWGIRAASLSAGRPALEQRGRPVSLAAELVAQRRHQGQQGLSRARARAIPRKTTLTPLGERRAEAG